MKLRPLFALIAVGLTLPFSAAKSDVNLVFSPISFTNVPSSGSFNVTLNLVVTAGEQVVAVNYFLQELSAAGFYIISRSVAGSPLSDTYSSDAMVAVRPGANLAGGGPAAGTNSLDLGANTATPQTTTGSALVATYSIGLDNVAPGTYTIQTFSVPGSGWVDQNQIDRTFNSQASLTVSVVPEPATWSFIVLGGVAALGVNRLRRTRRS